MKKIFNSKLFYFLLGIIVLSGINVFAKTVISADEVSFTPDDSTWDVSTIQEAIDDLYPHKIESLSLAIQLDLENTSSLEASGFKPNNYYFCIANMRNNVTVADIAGAEIIFSKFNASFLDSKYSTYHSYFKATSENIIFTFSGAHGVGINCYLLTTY